MRSRLWAALVLVALIVPSTVSASHARTTLPLRAGDEAADGALDWVKRPNRVRVADDGCLHYDYDDPSTCRYGMNKLLVYNAAPAGVDPATWPEPAGNVLDPLLDDADDIRDSQYRTCEDPVSCRFLETMSHTKSVLAFRAAGYDPGQIPLPDGGTRNFTADLLDTFTLGQFGAEDNVNDDIWAVIALNSVPYNGSEVEAAADTIQDAQQSNGGVAFTSQPTPSSDNTAAAVMALAPLGRQAFVDDALGYLRTAQIDDPDSAWRGCFASQPGESATAASTAWSILGLVAAGEDPLDWSVDGTSPPACLLGFEDPGGGFRNGVAPSSEPGWLATRQALAGLSWIPYGYVRAPVDPADRVREMTPGGINLTVDGAILRTGSTTRSTITVEHGVPRPAAFHGFEWDPRPRPVTVKVRPRFPATPTIDAPQQAPHGTAVAVAAEASPGSVRLVLPNGTVAGPGPHRIHLEEPGRHVVTATATNRIGETSPTVRDTIEATNRPPTIDAIEVPPTAAVDAEASVAADVGDPDGDPVAIRWRLDDRVVADGATPRLAHDEPGSVVVTVVAQDPWGGEATAHRVIDWTETPTPVDRAPDPGPTEADDAPAPASRRPDPATSDGRTRVVPSPSLPVAVAALVLAGRWWR